MDDVTAALVAAFAEVAPKLLEDPAEMQRRLGRRRSNMYLHPLRAWCVAVRASDRRINDTWALICPRTAISLVSEAHPGRYAEHEVTLDKPLLVRVCESVRIDPPGEPADHVARRLGCLPESLRHIRRKGILRTDPKPGLMGRRGKPVPLVYRPGYMDPQARERAGEDDVFACCWRQNAEMLPEDLAQAVVRAPLYRSIGGRETFMGWMWVCPRCGRRVQTLYYPLPYPDYPTWLGFAPALAEPMPRPAAAFACVRCHHVQMFSRCALAISWDRLILQLTGGLLYGREVQKPEWLKQERKRAYRPRKDCPARRRDQIEQLLVDTDLSYDQLAAQLGLTRCAVRGAAERAMKHRGVRRREELRALLRPREKRAAG